MTQSLCASTGTVKHLIISQYLFDSDQGFNFEADAAKDPRLNLVAQGLFDELVAITYPGCPDLAMREWHVTSDRTPFAKVQAAFRSVMDGDKAPTPAERGNLTEYYRSLRNEKFKEARLQLWKALPGAEINLGKLRDCTGNEVEALFNTWIDENSECLKITSLDLTYQGIDGRLVGRLAPELLVHIGNKFTMLPPEIGKFVQLKKLILTDHQFQTFPTEVLQLANLEVLDLSGNNIREIPSDIEKLGALQVLFLVSNAITELPPEIGNLTQLQQLNLLRNDIRTLPPQIGNLKNLTHLYLCHNRMKDLPSELENLSRLEMLTVSDNKIEEFPKVTERLPELKVLNLGENRLRVLPPVMRGFTKLLVLNLEKNQLQEISAAIGSFTELIDLGLNGNELKQLPREISNLVKLTALRLGHNKFEEVSPYIMGLLPHLQRLQLAHNPIGRIPPEVILTIKSQRNLRSDLDAIILAYEIDAFTSAVSRKEEGSSTSGVEAEATAYPEPSVGRALREVGTNLVLAQLFTFLSTSFLAYTLASIGEGS